MKRLKVLLVVLLVLSVAIVIGSNLSSQAVSPDNTVIWTPRPTNPTFALPGQQITVEVRSTVSIPTQGWTARLENDLKSWNATVNSVTTGTIKNGTESGYIFRITLPSDIPPELFKLVLNDTVNGGSINSPRSVKVETSFTENFYILHISDEHMAPGAATYPDGRNGSGGTTSEDLKHWVEPVVNLINPRYIQYTGDNVHQYYNASSWRGLAAGRTNLQNWLNSMNGYTCATVATTGNHCIGYRNYIENDNWKQAYEEIIGPRAFSFRMGQFYVLNYEWTSDQYFTWARNNYIDAYNDSGVTYRLVASHFRGYDGPWTYGNIVIENNTPAHLQIVGHNHSTTTVQTSPWPVLSIGHSEAATGFFNFQRSGSTWTCPQTSGRTSNKDYFTLQSNYGANLKVSAAYANANNGTATSNSCTIQNQINQRFYNGRVRFLMARGTYTVTGGEILAQYDYGSNSTAVVVKVDIAPSATTNLSITQTQGSGGDLYGNRLNNPSFEDDGGWAANPAGWSTSGSTPSADFAEAASAHSGSYILSHWSSSAYQVYTYQTKTNLPNGIYTLKAWIKRGSGQTECYMNAKDYGGSELKLNIPVTGVYTQITIPNIKVTNGQCTIGFYSNGNAGNWLTVDDVEFYLENLVLNPSFEDDNAWSSTIMNWNTTGANPEADFCDNTIATHSGNCVLVHWASTPYQVYTSQTKSNLPNGKYTIKAWVKSSGNQNNCYLYVKDYGGAERRIDLPKTGVFTQISITDIQITNGQCTFGVYSNALAGQWINVDDVEFYKQ